MKKKLAFFGGVLGAGAGIAALLIANSSSMAADHLDAPGVQTNPLADITDLYAWMSDSKVNLVMAVSPADDPATRHFGPSVQYVFHLDSIGDPVADASQVTAVGTETKIICTFASDTSAQCWVGNNDYVTGDPSNTAGVTSASGKVRLFAGTRSDPFFFNLIGFDNAVGSIVAAEVGSNSDPRDLAAISDAAGCPKDLNPTVVAQLRAKLTSSNPASAAHPFCTAGSGSEAVDCFKSLNVKAIVLQVDKSLLNSGSNTMLRVWGTTHTTPTN